LIHPFDHNFAAALRGLVAEERVEEERRVSAGMAADWPDYRYRCGILAGLKKLETIIDRLTEDKKGL
jgi:hypothetical protein